jgi:hypothetical protein
MMCGLQCRSSGLAAYSGFRIYLGGLPRDSRRKRRGPAVRGLSRNRRRPAGFAHGGSAPPARPGAIGLLEVLVRDQGVQRSRWNVQQPRHVEQVPTFCPRDDPVRECGGDERVEIPVWASKTCSRVRPQGDRRGLECLCFLGRDPAILESVIEQVEIGPTCSSQSIGLRVPTSRARYGGSSRACERAERSRTRPRRGIDGQGDGKRSALPRSFSSVIPFLPAALNDSRQEGTSVPRSATLLLVICTMRISFRSALRQRSMRCRTDMLWTEFANMLVKPGA